MTVIYPFVDPAALDEHAIAALAAAVKSVSAFDCCFPRTRWFGDDVLWLDPVPSQPFRDLTTAVFDAFPQYPPYGGAFNDVVPHLTVAESRMAGLSAARVAERSVQSGLPPATRLEEVLLIAGSQSAQSWRVVKRLPLHP